MDLKHLLDVLKNPPPLKQAAILPDFFLDHFLIAGSFEEFIDRLRTMAHQGGGNLMGTTQFIRRGGNSANVASAIHSLGVTPRLIVTTDTYGKRLLESLLDPGVSLENVHEDGALSSTVSIEVEHEGRRVNLMVSDSGSAAHFTFDDLTEKDLQAISECGLVVLENLNHNSEAVSLARDLFEYVRSKGDALTFMDTGDPSNDPAKIIQLAKEVVSDGYVDVLGLNENESAWFAWAITGKDAKWRDTVKDPQKWLSTAQFIAAELGVQIDLHTPHFSASIKDDNVVSVPSFFVESRILCGAGDAWSAGDIFGLLANQDTKDRLILANAVAALYVSTGTGEHASREDVLSFLEGKSSLSTASTKLLKLK
ncbi:MAG: carbohydrate kinase family protein [Candidatus Thorarchaeota archaeon]|nr:carbohydrate kinase family protein [Candidatus Thorarchaeota archaeon]